MREIKFEGMDKKGKWHKFTLYDVLGEVGMTEWEKQPEGGQRDKWKVYIKVKTSLIVPSTIRQFTGLFDKNGKEIYEGDIVKSKWGIEEIKNIIDCLGLLQAIQQDYLQSYVAIGNVWENPELLK